MRYEEKGISPKVKKAIDLIRIVEKNGLVWFYYEEHKVSLPIRKKEHDEAPEKYKGYAESALEIMIEGKSWNFDEALNNLTAPSPKVQRAISLMKTVQDAKNVCFYYGEHKVYSVARKDYDADPEGYKGDASYRLEVMIQGKNWNYKKALKNLHAPTAEEVEAT